MRVCVCGCGVFRATYWTKSPAICIHLLASEIKHVQDTTLHDFTAAAHPVLVLFKALDGCFVGLDQECMMDRERNKAQAEYQCDNDDEDPLRVEYVFTLK